MQKIWLDELEEAECERLGYAFLGWKKRFQELRRITDWPQRKFMVRLQPATITCPRSTA